MAARQLAVVLALEVAGGTPGARQRLRQRCPWRSPHEPDAAAAAVDIQAVV